MTAAGSSWRGFVCAPAAVKPSRKPHYSRVKSPAAARAGKTAGKIRHFRPILNRLFTATGKKLRQRTADRARIHPPLTRAGSTESPRGSFASTSNVGASNEIWRPVECQRHTAGSARNRQGSGAPLGRIAGRMAQFRDHRPGRAGRRAGAVAGRRRVRRRRPSRRSTSGSTISPAASSSSRAPGRKPTRPKRNRNEPDQLAELIGRLDRRLDQFANVSRQPLPPPPPPAMPPMLPSVQLPPSLDRAVAEIAARQRMLNGHAAPPRAAAAAGNDGSASRRRRRRCRTVPSPAPPPMPQAAPVYAPAPPPLPLPAQDLSGLEDQLRNITDQIETLRKPGVEQAINALREELGEIGRTLNDAMPRRAIDAIEQQIQGLNQRIAEGRQAGIDAGALGGIEHGLAEVRDALRGLTPAENLVGFNEAVDGLAHKIDLIVAQKDPATLAQLESAITTLREMTGHIASNETVHALAEQVQALGEKIEYIAHASDRRRCRSTISNSASRALADALAERAHSGDAVPPRLEALVESLTDKIEQIQQFARQQRRLRPSRGPHRQAGGEAGRFRFPARPSGSDRARPGRPAGAHRRNRRTPKASRAQERARRRRPQARYRPHPGRARSGARHARPCGRPPGHDRKGHPRRRASARRARRRDRRSARRSAARGAHGRGRAASIAGHGACLGRRLSRLLRRRRLCRAPQLPRLHRPPPQPRSAAAGGRPIADRSRSAGRSAARARLRAADIAGPIRPRASPLRKQPSAAPGRLSLPALPAANPASSPPPAAPPRRPGRTQARARRAPNQPRATSRRAPSLRGKLMKRVKSLFVAASIIAIVVGSVQIAGNVFDFGNSEHQDGAGSRLECRHDPDGGAPQHARTRRPALSPIRSRCRNCRWSGRSPRRPPPSRPPPCRHRPCRRKGCRRCSIRRCWERKATSPDRFPTRPPTAHGAPGGLTGTAEPPIWRPPADRDRRPQLRSAAIAGDAAAAYEVAVRFAEGRGVPVNLDEAARWYERAANKGLALAQFRYASLLEKGQGVKKDLAARPPLLSRRRRQGQQQGDA